MKPTSDSAESNAVIGKPLCDVPAAVCAALTRHLRDDDCLPAAQVSVERCWQRPFSTVLLLVAGTDGGERRFVCKQIREHPLNPVDLCGERRAEAEFHLLQKLHPAFGSLEHCSVPCPVAVFPALDALVTEYVEGESLSDNTKYIHYLSKRSRFNALQEHFYLCGQWLRRFQNCTDNSIAGPESLTHLLEHFRRKLSAIEESGDSRWPKNLTERVLGFLDRKNRALAGQQFLIAGSHGDFGPWNVIANDQGICVLDFFGFRNDPVALDLLSMLVFLDSCLYARANSRLRVMRLRQRFLAGFGSLPDMPDALVLLCEAFQRIISSLAVIVAKRGHVFERWQQSAWLDANIAWFRNPPEKSSL